MHFFKSPFGKKDNSLPVKLTSRIRRRNGWKDLTFSVTGKQQHPDGFLILTCKALYKKEVVGFKLQIINGMRPGIIGDEIDEEAFTPDGIVMHSIGNESERIPAIISDIYNTKASNKYSGAINFLTFSLNDTQAWLETGKYDFKVFFDHNDELELYTELYINVNLPEMVVEINEKDHEYRQNIVNILSTLA